jgi:F-type H+-transporting ATPase subunit b
MVPVLCASFLDVEPGLVFWTLVTFVCLAVLLRWKAWGPILHAVEEREKRIQEAVETAKKDREESQRLLDEHRKLVGEARREGAESVRKALAEAEVARQDLLQKSRKEAEEIVAQTKRQIDEQVKRARAELSGAVVDLAMDAAEKVMGEALSDPQRQRKLVEQYVQEFSQRPPQRQA